MSMSDSDVLMSKKELEFVLSQGEGYNIEFKESSTPAIGKEMCAFANASGGKILIGVSDAGDLSGVRITNKLRSEIQDIARNIDPKLSISIEDIGGALAVNIPEGKEKPYSVGGKFYLRQGANSQQLSRNEIREFFQKEGLILFDEKTNKNFDIAKDINRIALKNFLQLSNIKKILPMEDIFRNLNLLDGHSMRNAGVLLFSKDITRFFLQATITCVLFQGKTKYKILDRKEFAGNLYDNYIDALNYLRAKLNTEFIIKGGPREERLELPEDALREAILNAVAHRNYFVSGANIQIYIFSDRVEITNPGGLVNGLTLKDLGKRSLSRNNLLFGLMQRMDLVEKIGSGILRMKKAMKEYGLPRPKIESDENWFSIIFKRKVLEDVSGKDLEKDLDKDLEDLTDNQKKIIAEMKKNKNVTQKELSRRVGINEKNIRNNIAGLKERGLIERIGPDKGGYWEVIEKK